MKLLSDVDVLQLVLKVLLGILIFESFYILASNIQ